MASRTHGQLHILVVEDDDQVRRAVTDMLLLEDHHVMCASDGRTALEILRKNHFDLLITDLGMPGMSGLELCDRANESAPHVRVILMTGYASRLNEEDLRNRHVIGLINKPFKIKDLYRLM